MEKRAYPPARRMRTTRNRVRLLCAIAQRERLKPCRSCSGSLTTLFMTCVPVGELRLQGGARRLGARGGPQDLLGQAHLHAGIEELHPAGDDDIAGLDAR